MRLVAFCIKHRVTTIMVFITIVVFGIMGYSNLPLSLLPSIELPMAIVSTSYTGAGPEEVENLVTRTLESAISSVSGLDTMTSTSSNGSSMIMVTFGDDVNIDTAMVDMRDRIDRVKGYLPSGASSPLVLALDVDMMPVVQYALEGDNLAVLQQIAEDTITPALERIDGVASIDIYGGYSEEISIQTYSDRMAGYGLSVSYVAQMLTAENVAIPAGNVNNGSKTLTVRTTGEYSSMQDIANTIIPLPTGGTVRLNEIATVTTSIKEQTDMAKRDGQPALIIAVNKRSGVNTVQVAEKVNAEMERLVQENPNLSSVIVMDQSDYINQTVDSVIQNLILGVLFAALVLFVFLRNFSSTVVIAISMPICIFCTFLAMWGLGMTMNMMSLGGMAMGVGMIVDNSIVVLENIFSFRQMGKSRWESCIQGTGEVALSIMAGTLTTVAVFLPIGLSGGMTGMLFKEFTITIAALLLSSLFIALTLVPLLCYALLDRKGTSNIKKKEKKAKKAHKEKKPLKIFVILSNGYAALLKFFITKRLIACIISFALMVVFIGSAAMAGVELIPTMDQSLISVSVSMPIGSELKDTVEISDRVASILREEIPEADDIYYYASGASSSTIYANLVPMGQRNRSSQQIGNAIRPSMANVAGAEISVSSAGMMSMDSMTGAVISFNILGDDYDELTEIANDLVDQIAQIPNTIEVKSSASEQVPQVSIQLNRENAANFGLTAATIGQYVSGHLQGTTATQLRVSGNEIDIVVKGDESSSESLDALRNVPIPTATGGSVPLELVANVTTELAPQSISRDNQSRAITISGDMDENGDLVAITQAVLEITEAYDLPMGYIIDIGGQSEQMAETFGSLLTALVVALFLVYLVLASQFESFVMPVIVMMILPLGLMGGLFGLPVTGNPISVPAFIGVIMLAGIVVNSSIVLIDYIKQRRQRGESKNEAILNACPRRVRPVLMTTMTTILGLIPMALGMGEGNEMMAPMAIVMIAGLIISTIVTLLFTPVYYSLIDSLTSKFSKKKPTDPPSTTDYKELQEALSVPGITE